MTKMAAMKTAMCDAINHCRDRTALSGVSSYISFLIAGQYRAIVAEPKLKRTHLAQPAVRNTLLEDKLG